MGPGQPGAPVRARPNVTARAPPSPPRAGDRRRRKGARMSAAGALLGLVLLIFELVLVARIVLDWVGVLAPAGGGGLARARGWTHAVTEPVIAPVRRLVRPVRLGPLAID